MRLGLWHKTTNATVPAYVCDMGYGINWIIRPSKLRVRVRDMGYGEIG